MRSFKCVPHFVTKKEVILPFAITVYGRRKIFISPLLLLFFSSALRNRWVQCILVGIVLLLNSLSHYIDNNFKEVFFEENILKCANEKSKSIFCQIVQTLLRVLKLFAFIVIVWLVLNRTGRGVLKYVVLFFKK